MTSNAMHGVSFRLAGLSAGKYSLFCIQQMYFVMSDGPCRETKYYFADLESFPFMSPIRVCLQVHVIANARLVRFVCEAFSKLAKYKRDSGKWKMPTRNVATYAAIPIPQRARADEELMLPLAWWRNSEPCLNRTPRHNTTGWVCLQDIWTLYQYVINRTRQFTVRDLSCCIAPHL